MACEFTYKGDTYSREEIIDKIKDENLYVEGNYSKEKQWLEDKLGLNEDKDFELIKGLMESGSFGKFMEDGKILLSENFEQGTSYHEAFHRVFNMYLSDNERSILRAEFNSRKDKNEVISQFKEKYPNLAYDDLVEEILAEEFRDYTLSNGTYKFAEKEKQGFFHSLYKFLKSLLEAFKGNITTQEELYSKINEGGFKSAPNTSYQGLVKNRAITYTMNNEKIRISELNTQRLMRGTIYLLLEKLKENGLSFNDLENKDISIDDLLIGNSYGTPILNQLIGKLGQKIAKDNPTKTSAEKNKLIVNDPITKLLLHSYNTKDTKLIKYHLGSYLNAFKIKISNLKDISELESEDLAQVTNEVVEGSKGGDTNYSKSSIENDPYSSISSNIKLTLATIPKQDNKGNKIQNELGLNEMEDPQFIFMLLSQTLAGVPADPFEFMKKLQSISGKFPYVKDIIERVGLTQNNLESLSVTDINKRNDINKFIQAFAKTRFNYNLTMIDSNSGSIYSLDAEIDNSSRKIREEWQSAFNMNSKEIINNFKGELSKLTPKDYKKFATDILKLNLTDEQLNNTSIEKDLKAILFNINKLVNPKTPADKAISVEKGIMNDKGELAVKPLASLITNRKGPYDISGYFESIAKTVAFENEFVNLQHYNSEGKLVYGISLNTYFSLTTDRINYIISEPGLSPEERAFLLEIEYPHLFTPYSENSLLREFSTLGKKINIGISDGVKNKDGNSGTPSSSLKGPMRLSQVFNDTLSGIYHFMQTGDRSTMNTFTVTDENGKKLFYEGQVKDNGDLGNDVIRIFINYLKDEVNTYKTLKSNPSDFQYVIKNNDDYKLRYFKEAFNNTEINNLVNAVDLDAELEKPIYAQRINTFLLSKVKEYNNLLAKNEVLTIIKGAVPGISSEFFVQNKFELGGRTPTIEDLVRISYINQVIANIEQSKMFFGDFAGLKNATEVFKRLSQWNSTKKVSINSKMNNDFVKELNKILPFRLSDGTYINYNDSKGDNTDIVETVLSDDKFSLSEKDIEDLRKIAENSFMQDFNDKKVAEGLAEKFANNYTKAEEGDGLSYVNMYFYRELLIKSGSWDDVDQNIFEKSINNQELTSDEIIRMTMLKPNYLGPVNSDIFMNGVRKTSYFPLIPQLIRGTNLEALHESMLKKGIDVVHLDSAAKFGARGDKGVLKSFYNADGSLNTDNWISNPLKWEFIGIQLDMNKEAKGKITQATQATKNMLHNVFENGVPRDYEGTKPFNSLTLSEKLASSELARLSNEYVKLNKENIDISFQELVKEIGLVNVGDKYKINNWSKLKAILIDEAISRGSTDNILNSIDKFITSDGTHKYINTLSNKEKIEQILMSYVTNNIIKQKRYGDALPQSSIKGFEKLGTNRTKNGKIYYSSDELKFRDSKGRTEFAVPLPDNLYDYVNKLQGRDFEERLATFNSNLNSHISENLREFHGVRIPNQAYASNTPGIIAKYIHPTANTIIVPTAFVTQTGSDFDIDKLFTYFKKFSIQDFKITDIRNISSGSRKDYIHNQLIDIAIKLMLHPLNSRQLYTAVDDSPLKEELAKDMLEVMTGSRELPDSKITISEIFDPMTSYTKFKDFFAGLAGVGQTARHIPNQSFTQIKNLTINPENSVMFNDNNGSVGGIRDVKGYWITDTLSMLLTGSVDIGKYPYLRYLGINTRTLPIAVYLIRRGVNYREIMMFLKQPLIQKYLEFAEINESEFAKSTKRGKLDAAGNLVDGLNLSNTDVVKRAFMWIGGDVTLVDDAIDQSKRINPSILLENILNLESADKDLHNEAKLKNGLRLYNKDLELNNKLTVNEKEKINQLRMLAEFLVYTEHSKIFEKFVGMANPDTTSHKDLQEVLEYYDLVNEVRSSGFFNNFDTVWFGKDDFELLSPYYNAIKVKSSYTAVDYVLNNPQVTAYLNAMSDVITNNIFDKETKQKIKKTIFSDFVLRQIFRYLESANINTKNLLRNNSVAKRVENIQTNPNHPLHDNLFIKSLLPMIEATDLNDTLYDSLLLYKKKLDAYEINLLTDEFSEIAKQDPTLYRDLILVNFIQAGLMNHPYQLNQILPADSYQTIVNNALFTMNIDKEELDTFFEKFVLTRPNLLEKANEYFANEYSASYNPKTKQYKVKIDGDFRNVNGNGFNILNYFGKKETNARISIMDTLQSSSKEVIEQPINKEIEEKTLFNPELPKVNIWAESKENTILSNLAVRPFIFQGDEFKSVEEYFQLQKANYLKEELYKDGNEAELEKVVKHNQKISDEIVKNENNPFQIKQLGRKFIGLDTKAWDKAALDEMKKVLKPSFEQNPEALKALLDTGKAQLTHAQDTGRWKVDFPQALMEVRQELTQEQPIVEETKEDTPPWDEECN